MMEFGAGLIGAAAGGGIGVLVDRLVVAPWITREIQARIADGRETRESALSRMNTFQIYRLGIQLLFPVAGYVGGVLFGAR